MYFGIADDFSRFRRIGLDSHGEFVRGGNNRIDETGIEKFFLKLRVVEDLLCLGVQFFAKSKKKFYVVVDGLDHVWREQLNIDQMNHLFNYLLPCPKNVVLIVGTQRVADLQLPHGF